VQNHFFGIAITGQGQKSRYLHPITELQGLQLLHQLTGTMYREPEASLACRTSFLLPGAMLQQEILVRDAGGADSWRILLFQYPGNTERVLLHANDLSYSAEAENS